MAKIYWINHNDFGNTVSFINKIWTRLFCVQMIDYVNLCYIVEAFLKKNIIQIRLFRYLLLYTILLNGISIYLDMVFDNSELRVSYYLAVHIMFTLFEIILITIEIGVYEEDFNLKYFKKFGASNTLNTAYKIRENLMMCVKFCVFTQYGVIVNYFLGVDTISDISIHALLAKKLHIGCILASFVTCISKENRNIRIAQILNLGISLVIRIYSFLLYFIKYSTAEMIIFQSISAVEIACSVITIYFAYEDFKNFGKGLINRL